MTCAATLQPDRLLTSEEVARLATRAGLWLRSATTLRSSLRNDLRRGTGGPGRRGCPRGAPVEPKLASAVTHRQPTDPESRVVEERISVQPPGRRLWYAITPGSQFPETAWAYHLGHQAPSWQQSCLRVPVSESYAVETPRLAQVCKLPPLVSCPRNAALTLDRAAGALDRKSVV